ncbi:MAG: YqaE/Pmp3 family membrane protein [Chloroflexota bacterium]|nr:YqaE/Pmp3 family membrane protein [Chloroflexota bacterium]MDQ5864470.1 YqaE/Pmp3 family membrane protein [Chloroflexota bacterium]
MGCVDALFCIFLPPLASGVRARGCGAMLFVFLMTCIFWLPGCLVAFIMTLNYNRERRR